MFAQLALLFSSTPLEGPEQMALDEILLCEASQPLLRLYSWKAPCVTFGYFQRWEKVRAAFPNRSLIRRWSGGGSVEHGDDVTFSLIIPASEPAGNMAPSLFYQCLHSTLVEVLREFGFPARLIEAEEATQGEACFSAPALHDIMIGKQKIVGGAQRRSAGNLLHQGSLNYFKRESEEVGLALEISSLPVKPFFLSLGSKLSPNVTFLEEEQSWLVASSQLALERYRTKEWIQKR